MYSSSNIIVLAALCFVACGSDAPNQDTRTGNHTESSIGEVSGGKDERRGEVANPGGPGTIILPKHQGKPGDSIYEYGGHKDVDGTVRSFGPNADWARLGVDPSGSDRPKN